MKGARRFEGRGDEKRILDKTKQGETKIRERVGENETGLERLEMKLWDGEKIRKRNKKASRTKRICREARGNFVSLGYRIGSCRVVHCRAIGVGDVGW